MQGNGVNYFKGVLLCSRPNQSPSINKQKPFCGRVSVGQQLGLVPTKQYGEHKIRKRKLPVLSNHKKWLDQFKKQIQQKKNKQAEQQQKKQQYLQKLRQQGRERMKQVSLKQSSSQTLENNNSHSGTKPDVSPQKNKQNKQSTAKKVQKVQANPHKKKAKPAWAHTQQQAQQVEQHQVDELLNFFQKGETQIVKDYMTDQNIKKVLQQLKNKIQALKQQGKEWRNNQMIKIQDQKRRQAQQEDNQDGKDDILSRISRQSGGQSVTSQKTAERVQQLQKKKQQAKQWDNISTSKKTSIASVDEQIAKHIADEILRNYPNLKHHSNQSIRKLLQKQAKEELKGTS